MVGLTLFLSERDALTRTLVGHVQRLCDEQLPGRYELEVVDVTRYPELARREVLTAAPTLVRWRPQPQCRVQFFDEPTDAGGLDRDWVWSRMQPAVVGVAS